MKHGLLVIGGMKCATTTLHEDLQTNPHVVCIEKEAGTFGPPNEFVRSTPVRKESATLLCEICTRYSMLPDVTGVAERALQAVGPDLKIVYIVRNPILRTISHHQHNFNWKGEGKMGPDINQEIRNHSSLIDYSKYFMQLQPWINAFGLQNILVIRFEDYVSNRRAELSRLCEFINVPDDFGDLDPEGANRSQSRLVASPIQLAVYHSRIYQKWIRPILRGPARLLLRRAILNRADTVETKPSESTLEFIRASVAEDVRKLSELLGRQEPLWDLDQTIEKLCRKESNASG